MEHLPFDAYDRLARTSVDYRLQIVKRL